MVAQGVPMDKMQCNELNVEIMLKRRSDQRFTKVMIENFSRLPVEKIRR
jgi:hypothetical protein